MAEKINKNYKYKPLRALQKEEIVQGIASCDTAILSRAITLLESVKKEDKAINYDAIKSMPNPENPSFKIGITGSPGVGKITFIISSIYIIKEYPTNTPRFITMF